MVICFGIHRKLLHNHLHRYTGNVVCNRMLKWNSVAEKSTVISLRFQYPSVNNDRTSGHNKKIEYLNSTINNLNLIIHSTQQ